MVLQRFFENLLKTVILVKMSAELCATYVLVFFPELSLGIPGDPGDPGIPADPGNPGIDGFSFQMAGVPEPHGARPLWSALSGPRVPARENGEKTDVYDGIRARS